MSGWARLIDERLLAITTPKKRGKKEVLETSLYIVRRLDPDPKVACPAFALHKGHMEDVASVGSEPAQTFVLDKEVWHVSIQNGHIECDCPAKTYQRQEGPCKHCKGMIAVGLIPGRK